MSVNFCTKLRLMFGFGPHIKFLLCQNVHIKIFAHNIEILDKLSDRVQTQNEIS